jgi:ubiquinone/menaquinone biosynthesis C-methylase UbiE
MFRLLLVKIYKLSQSFPAPARKALNILGLGRLRSLLLDKHTAELAFQTSWAKAYDGKPEAMRRDLEDSWRKNRELDRIVETCRLGADSKVLDVGCGIATVLHVLKGERYGIDPLAEEYKKIYSYPREFTIIKGSGEAIPFQDSTFDVVFCSNVLDHVTDPGKTLDEILRVLKKEGFLNLIVEVFPVISERNAPHPHCLTEDHVGRLLSGRFREVFCKTVPWPGGRNGSSGSIKILRKI